MLTKRKWYVLYTEAEIPFYLYYILNSFIFAKILSTSFFHYSTDALLPNLRSNNTKRIKNSLSVILFRVESSIES